MFIPEILKESKRNMSFRDKKALIHGFQCINTDNGIAVIDCRIYAGKSRYSSQIIATIWIHNWKSNRFSHGVGIAGGYGYHKGSQAIESALKEMGITLDGRIGGLGYDAVPPNGGTVNKFPIGKRPVGTYDACKAAFASIMKALGYPSFVPGEFCP